MAYGWQSGKSERLLRNSVDRVVFTGACSRQFFFKCDIKEGNESVVPRQTSDTRPMLLRGVV
jgi:hypothetical protein